MILTPQFQAGKLSKTIGIETPIFIKREDLHPYHSHKGRSIPKMIEYYSEKGKNNFVISSSGNAALAALLYINEYNRNHENSKLNLKIFVGKKIPLHKLKHLTANLKTEFVSLEQVQNPKQTAFKIDKEDGAKNLRQSTDLNAPLGYEELADELLEIKDLSAVFIPTSSGTTAVGLNKAFHKKHHGVQIHIVQTHSCHPIAEEFDDGFVMESIPSLASAIVDNVALRKNEVVRAIETTGGHGWIADNQQIREVVKLIKYTTNLEVSPNSALSVVGLLKALEHDWKFKGPIVCLFTGE